MRCRSTVWRSSSRTPLAIVAVVSLATTALAAPQITNISPRGLQVGQPTTVVITGSDLAAQPRLLLPTEIAQQTVKGEAKPDRVEIEVTIAESAAPGLVPLRLATATGISPAVIVGIDRLPDRALSSQTADSGDNAQRSGIGFSVALLGRHSDSNLSIGIHR